MNQKSYHVAVVGATGVVGREMVKVLEQREFPVAKLTLLASENSLGKNVSFNDNDISVDVLSSTSFDGVDIALFSAGGEVSRKFAPIAAEAGAVVIDNTSVFRMEEDIPLVVPEVNPDALKFWKNRNIISNPNCSTIQMVLVLSPLNRLSHIKRVVVSTYQAVSGAGVRAMEELSSQSVALFSQKECKQGVFPHRIAFNCIPHIDKFEKNGFTKEEMKMILETKKIMGDESIRVCATAVRVPVFCGHSESVNIEFDDPVDVDEAREVLSQAPGVCVVDEPNLCRYPLAIDATGKDDVYVGRIRRDESVENGLALWIVADNLRKGAALNAVQIAEMLAKDYFR